MDFLIVDNNPESRQTLERHLTPYGDVHLAEGGESALAVIRSRVESGAYLDVIIMELEQPDMDGWTLISTLREWDRSICESAGYPPARILVATNVNDRETVLACLRFGCAGFLVKPVTAATLGAALSRIGIEPPEHAAPEPVEQPIANAAGPDASPQTAIAELLKTAGQFSDLDFRIRLEKVLTGAGPEARELVTAAVFAEDLNLKTKMNVIRVMGYVKNARFLDILEAIITSGASFLLVKEAVIAVSKYNERKAFSILSESLKMITDEALLDQIGEAIARIRQDDPILALIPRFLSEYEKPTFRAVVETFKRILTPEDSRIFFDYLGHEAPQVVMGSLEILSCTGDDAIFPRLREFLAQRVARFFGPAATSASEMARIVLQFRQYLERHHQFGGDRFPEMERLFTEGKDPHLRNQALAILAMSSHPEVLNFIRSVYDADPALREIILDGMAFNPAAAEFLMQLFPSSGILKGKVIQSLMKTSRGSSFLLEDFFNMELPEQELIAGAFEFQSHPQGKDFLERILDSDLNTVKTIALSKLPVVTDGPIRDLLLDPSRESLFLGLGAAWLNVARASFPIQMVTRVFAALADGRITGPAIREYLPNVVAVTQADIILPPTKDPLFQRISEVVLAASDISVNVGFLEILKRINVLHPESLADLAAGLNAFIKARGQSLSDAEQAEVKAARENLRRIQKDLESFSAFDKEVEALLTRQSVSTTQIDQYLNANRIPLALHIDATLALLSRLLQQGGNASMRLGRVLQAYPRLLGLVKERLERASAGLATSPPELTASSRLACRFESLQATAFFVDQIKQLFPSFEVSTEPDSLEGEDALLCDTAFLSRFLDRTPPPVRKIYLLLQNRDDFANFQAMNPKVFMNPLSVFKVLKMVLADLYLA